MMQTTRITLVLLSTITLLAQFSGGSSTASQDSDPSSCSDSCANKPRPLSVALSLIGYVVCSIVSITPLMRVNKKVYGQENFAKHRWFMAFLAIVTLDYVAWVGYSFRGCYCEAKAFMMANSIIGATFSCLWALTGLVRDRGIIVEQGDKVTLAGCFLLAAVTMGCGSHENPSSGYLALAGAVVAHLCRLLGTDYMQLSRPQFIISLIGCFGGLLSIQHPDLAAARPFWISSLIIAGIRGLECLWWILLYSLHSSPTLRRWLRIDARGWSADARA